tara:strand:+ start:81 stop:782 length:702 start_codon:yes stop_codon:yes gene_type:complete
MVVFLKRDFSILIYEKEKILNSILDYQLSNYNNSNLVAVNNNVKLFQVTNEKKFDTCILNLNDLDHDLKKFLDNFQNKNNHTNIIGYYENNFKSFVAYENKLFLLKKPFRLSTLNNHIDNIKMLQSFNNVNKFLMKHIIFFPSKKIVSNKETKKNEHLTEKENKLLIYLSNRKNVEILKKDLLTDIWGVSDDINTHTLETHIYRLKQKLNKLDPNLSFSLINKNGLYCLKYND